MSIFNLGEPDDYRVPDGGLLRERLNRVRAPTAALVIEIVSPDDDTLEEGAVLRQARRGRAADRRPSEAGGWTGWGSTQAASTVRLSEAG